MTTFWFGTFAMLFHATSCFVGNEKLKDERYMVVIKVYKFTIFQILRDFYVLLHIALALHNLRKYNSLRP